MVLNVLLPVTVLLLGLGASGGQQGAVGTQAPHRP